MKEMGIVLALTLILSITSTGVAQAAANPVRDMPESVEAGADYFSVTVTWTAPADDFKIQFQEKVCNKKDRRQKCFQQLE